MALVNAFENSSHDVFNHEQPMGKPGSRIMKIRSIWPFPVKSSHQTAVADSGLPPEEDGDLNAPSSFIT